MSAASKNGNIYLLRVNWIFCYIFRSIIRINFSLKLKNFFFIKGAHAFNFDTVTHQIKNDHPEMMQDVFPGLPYWIDSTIVYEKVNYFFRDIWLVENFILGYLYSIVLQ